MFLLNPAASFNTKKVKNAVSLHDSDVELMCYNTSRTN